MLPAPEVGGNELAMNLRCKGWRRKGLRSVEEIITTAAVGDYRFRRHLVGVGSGVSGWGWQCLYSRYRQLLERVSGRRRETLVFVVLY